MVKKKTSESEEGKPMKVDIGEGNIRITGDRLILGGDLSSENLTIENPVIEIPANKDPLDELIPAMWTIAGLTGNDIFQPQLVKRAFKGYQKAYRQHKKESSEKKE